MGTPKAHSNYPVAAQTQPTQGLTQHSPGKLLSIKKGSEGKKQKPIFSLLLLTCMILPLPYVTGCEVIKQTEASAQTNTPRRQLQQGPIPVDVAIAQTGVLTEPLEYIGHTRPIREVSLRAQAEGRLLKLNVDVGDSVRQGQVLAQLDDTLLVSALKQAQAELAALNSEVSRLQAQVENAKIRSQQARLELQQADTEASRLSGLSQTGAISEQQEELAKTAAATAQQNLLSALKQIRTEEQAVAAAQDRVRAQQAVVAQNQERKSYALLASPITGVVLERVTEPGNLVPPGSEVLRLGDFKSVKVELGVSDRELANIRIGQSVSVRLDAFTSKSVLGKVTRISPAANQDALQVPIEVTIPNSNGRIGSGLLTRVSFEPDMSKRVIVPETALKAGKKRGRGGEAERGRNSASITNSSNPKLEQAIVFVVKGEGEQATVEARSVEVGEYANGKVEIISGLQSGERFVARSGRSLQDGEAVRLSVLSP
ncbi:MAG: HlyD family efflux transporter periplasmic adaptor subunit [Symploca sp. SIO3C6]|uniref:HlyD family efflux transporter periplasmic adaptor subunit n=1 Tax=Symploca sp. SIO1C4 TaxID=2607765 RepID=A0A6B3NEU3_9CYAN|nr:HlyD family efflux transporter periplasmic adaptor subunit [Symploca sp. SIO3C6]NER31639.1 HlyD family efflux transporter periplasmic adaptor subunit [Symploca sp. SIO1C4]